MILKDKKGIKAIMRDFADLEGEKMEYTLMSLGGYLRPVYAIEIKTREECGLGFFGTDKQRALSVFKLIVANSVTPCTLQDIAEDMSK